MDFEAEPITDADAAALAIAAVSLPDGQQPVAAAAAAALPAAAADGRTSGRLGALLEGDLRHFSGRERRRRKTEGSTT